MSLIIVQRPHLAPPAAGSGLIASGALTTNSAASFNLNPLSAGAANGDTMVVASLWEDDTPVGTPSGWTNITDVEAPATTTARWHIDKIKFSGTPSSSVTWSYAGGNGVAYAWAIVRGITTVGTLTNSKYDLDAPDNWPALSITVGTEGALVFALADGVNEVSTGVTNLTNMAAVTRDTTSVLGRAAMVGYKTSSGNTSFHTGAVNCTRFQLGWLPLS